MKTNQNEEGKARMLKGIIAALLLIAIAGLYFVYSGHKDNNDLTAEKAQLDSSFHSLSDTLELRKTQIEQITGKNVQLDSTIATEQALIEKERSQISVMLAKNKMTRGELDNAKKMIGEYEVSLSGLQKQFDELCIQNKQLTNDNAKLSSDLTSENKTTAELNELNNGLSKKVTLGSLLQLANVEVDGIKQKSNGKEVTVKNIKAVESLRLRFETGQNKVLAPGHLSLYIRIINPKGETISVADQGSGNLTLTETKTQVQYSRKADFDWNQANKKVVVYWKQNITSAGTYKVEIYQAGYLIGKGEVKLG
jgi:hypothetical protein